MRRSPIIKPAIVSSVVILIFVGIYMVAFSNINFISNRSRFTLSVGKTYTTKTGSTIQLVRVPGDSRCPKNGGCIAVGSAAVEVNISGQDYSIPAKLYLSDGLVSDNIPDSIDFGEATDATYTLQIIKLTPEPVLSKQRQQSDYRATFLLTKK
ncbi:MAG TPA: hypothetical protein VJB65_03680 [Patescibacteria group bacterium]|nr:hypothetical protein [Patescibacteria group bacterium]